MPAITQKTIVHDSGARSRSGKDLLRQNNVRAELSKTGKAFAKSTHSARSATNQKNKKG